ITKHGGTAVAQYDPAITTHIVSDRTERQTLRVLQLSDVSDVPTSVPIVPWKWV
ncbi:hypothetical protein BOTBODRAFT_94301, partial [Botryobasidium botryosum FD-172 SS1]